MGREAERRITLPEKLPPDLRGFCLRFSRLASLGTVSSAIMHDIRNSLTVISGITQIILLKQGRVPQAEIVRRLEKVMDQVKKIMSSFDRVDSFARRAGGEETELSPDSALDNAIYGMKREIDAAQIDITRPEAGFRGRLRCDVGLFEFVLLELLSSCLAEAAPGGELILAPVERDGWWELEMRLPSETDADAGRSKLAGRADGFSFVAALLVLEEIGGELYLLSEADAFGWRLRVPIREEED